MKVGEYLGFIKVNKNGKLEYNEAEVKAIRFGKRKTSVYAGDMSPFYLAEIERNTELVEKGHLVIEKPFITDTDAAMDLVDRCMAYNRAHEGETI